MINDINNELANKLIEKIRYPHLIFLFSIFFISCLWYLALFFLAPCFYHTAPYHIVLLISFVHGFVSYLFGLTIATLVHLVNQKKRITETYTIAIFLDAFLLCLIWISATFLLMYVFFIFIDGISWFTVLYLLLYGIGTGYFFKLYKRYMNNTQ